ncbi:MAG: HTH domain-containing protein [Firmicutes bacterium]|nr:HTH domain-containing protein [Bacillota bacterium]
MYDTCQTLGTEEPDIPQDAIGERFGTTRCVIQKKIKLLKEDGCIECVGGKRYGH